jgi:hypothetical protein
MGNTLGSGEYKFETSLGNVNVHEKTIDINLDKFQIENAIRQFQFQVTQSDAYHATWEHKNMNTIYIICEFEKLPAYKVQYTDWNIFLGPLPQSYDGPRLKMVLTIKYKDRITAYQCKSFEESYDHIIFDRRCGFDASLRGSQKSREPPKQSSE